MSLKPGRSHYRMQTLLAVFRVISQGGNAHKKSKRISIQEKVSAVCKVIQPVMEACPFAGYDNNNIPKYKGSANITGSVQLQLNFSF